MQTETPATGPGDAIWLQFIQPAEVTTAIRPFFHFHSPLIQQPGFYCKSFRSILHAASSPLRLRREYSLRSGFPLHIWFVYDFYHIHKSLLDYQAYLTECQCKLPCTGFQFIFIWIQFSVFNYKHFNCKFYKVM